MKTPWLFIYVVSCALTAGIITAGATYWNWELGAYAAIGGAGFGFLGYLLIRYGPKRPDPSQGWRESYGKLLEQLEEACDLGLHWKGRALEARDLLKRARPYVGSAPFEGSLTVEQAIEAFLYREEGATE